MKLIRKSGWEKEYACTGVGNGDDGCGATLLVEKEDLFHTVSLFNKRDVYITFKCSQCGALTDIVDYPYCATSLPSKEDWEKAHPNWPRGGHDVGL